MCNGFTKIDNSIIENANISFDAKGIYIILARYINIPNFKINKTHVKSITGLGEIRFNRAWKELKENGLLIQEKKSVKGRFEYVYTLKVDVSKPKIIAPIHIDSDGDIPIDGQLSIDDVAMPVEEKEVEVIAEQTGLDTKQSKELLKVANNSVIKVLEGYKYAMQKSNVKNLFSYTKWAIKNNKFRSSPAERKGSFNNYKQRSYNFNELEKKLTAWETNYELPV